MQAAELLAMPDIRYPPTEVIRKIYQALGDYFQIAAGLGDGNFYDFDLPEFVKRFKLNALETTYAIQAMEQEEIISYNEQIFIPSKAQVICSREVLQEWENTHPEEDILIKSLLRSYSGIWDQPTSINELQLAKSLRINEKEIKERLSFLHQSGVLHYQPRKETPQICYLLPRTKASELYISPERYGKRKKAYQKRIDAMASYLQSKGKCRTKIICSYFGDEVKEDCEICDYCVREKNQNVDKSSFENIAKEIKDLTQKGEWLPQEIFAKLSGLSKEKIDIVLKHFIQEGYFSVKDDGKISLK
jgi:ATP-dependent DNA helicase RecQ